jgi:hypothetical protein
MISTGQASTSGTVALSANGSTKYAVIFSTFCNVASATQTFSVHALMAGASVGPTNKIISEYSLPAGDSFFLPYEKLLLDAGESIVVVASANTAITYMLSYTTL